MFLFSGAQRKGSIVLVSFMCLYGIYFCFNSIILKPDLPPLVLDSVKTPNKEINFQKSSDILIKLKSSDPNTWDFSDWNQFGLSKKQVKTIEKYKISIGGFSSISQLKKCHVISSNKVEKIKKYAVFKAPLKRKNPTLSSLTLVLVDSIPNYELNNISDTLFLKKTANQYYYYVDNSVDLGAISLDKKIQNLGTFSLDKNNLISIFNKFEPKKIVRFDINKADAVKLSSIRGIGKVFSERIINYRNLLGGFVCTSQFEEIYGLKEEICSKLIVHVFVDTQAIKTINLNEISIDSLKQHPYFNWSLSNAIVNYRYQHGEFKSKLNIKKIHLVNDEIYRKIAPYISVS
jgi:DNA uptake protein ComE-like DNA-binding protein